MAFFSVAMILAVVAMCSNRVGAGIAILMSALGSLVVCVVLMMTVALGAVIAGASDAMEQNQKMTKIVPGRR